MSKLYPDVWLGFVGTVGGFERPLVERANITFSAYDEVQAGPVHGVNPLRAAASLFKLLRGTWSALGIVRRHQPDAILSTGGWASLPVALAGRWRGVPLLIYLPDVEPGRTINILKRFARRVAVTVDESQKFFKAGQAVVTGYPLRASMGAVSADDGRAHFGLSPDKKTLLVFGGSRGARAINIAFGDILPHLLARGDVQVIHITGTLDWERSQAQVEAVADHPDYHAFDYLHDDMALAFAAADLAVCRAGASILGECPLFHLPAILIPLAYSWHYQQVNADYLAERGAAIHLDEGDMSAELLPTIARLLDAPEGLDALREGMAALAQPEGSANIARELAELAGGTR